MSLSGCGLSAKNVRVGSYWGLSGLPHSEQNLLVAGCSKAQDGQVIIRKTFYRQDGDVSRSPVGGPKMLPADGNCGSWGPFYGTDASGLRTAESRQYSPTPTSVGENSRIPVTTVSRQSKWLLGKEAEVMMEFAPRRDPIPPALVWLTHARLLKMETDWVCSESFRRFPAWQLASLPSAEATDARLRATERQEVCNNGCFEGCLARHGLLRQLLGQQRFVGHHSAEPVMTWRGCPLPRSAEDQRPSILTLRQGGNLASRLLAFRKPPECHGFWPTEPAVARIVQSGRALRRDCTPASVTFVPSSLSSLR